jgi:hypothetical protein
MSAAPFTFYAEPLRRCRSGLLDEARNGNPEAFAEMVSPYLPTLYRRARGLTGNTADAQDVSQEAVLKAWSRLDIEDCGEYFNRPSAAATRREDRFPGSTAG